jgi:multiple sugar transport system permease protein
MFNAESRLARPPVARASRRRTAIRGGFNRSTGALSAAHRKDAPLAWILVAPALIGFAVFAAYPALRGIYLSFTDYQVLTAPVFNGIKNYQELVGDGVFWNSVLVTIYFVALAGSVTIALSLITSVILHRLGTSTLVRGLVIMPFLISNIVAGIVWSWMLDSQLGIVNIILKTLTGHTILFFTSSGWAIPSLAAVTIWKGLGYTSLLLFAGLQTIPHPVYEAARLDGAGEISMFFRITIPLLRPVLAMVIILTVINEFQIFDLVQVTTKGGPENSSNVHLQPGFWPVQLWLRLHHLDGALHHDDRHHLQPDATHAHLRSGHELGDAMTTDISTVAEQTHVPTVSRRRRRRVSIGRVIAWAWIVIVLIAMIFPFYWILRTALSTNGDLAAHPSSLLPVGFTFGAFQRVLGLATVAQAKAQGGSGASIDLAANLRNSIIYATLWTAFVVFFSTLAAYAFSRLHWRGRNLLFSVMMLALMIPTIMTFLPNFLLIRNLGLLNTFAGLILPGALFSAFNIFYLRQFFLGMSGEIEEAALIDGAGKVRVLFSVILPNAVTPIATLSILGFITAWNDYFWPLLVTSNGDAVRPLTLALAAFEQSSPGTATDWAGLMAAAIVAAVPMFVLFLIFGRRIVDSIGFTGVR